ncbi:ESPR-type extended signal peptide-containing protein [Veillonella sp. R32]|uniref:ESPR-type extended signal peptide-containing protein n=1 Tax=Veillonella sp. R32 TaxID=2021312 RepID=UPI00138A5B78|nr:ESPR-type extended signal peptide-containing protein [Veillonella sp. R32]KAF1683744.1 hypothetical protein VER_00915 [Veillonella sp. R32]
MNKIYKIIWSRTKNCYVVASELAKGQSRNKSVSAVKKSALALGVALALVGVIPVGQVAAAGNFIDDENGIAIAGQPALSYKMAKGEKSIAIGWTDQYENVTYQVLANGDNSIVLGNGSQANGDESLAIGRYSETHSDGVISIGKWAGSGTGGTFTDKAKNSINIGTDSGALAENAIALGTDTQANSKNSVAIGSSAITRGKNSTALGNNTVANGDSSVALGKKAFVVGASGIAIGEHSLADGERSMALGATGATEWDALLEREANGEKISPDEKEAARLVWLSERTTAEGKDSLAMMNGAKAEGDKSIAMGTHANSKGNSAISIGDTSSADGEEAIAIGNKTKTLSGKTIAIGGQSQSDNITQIGTNSILSMAIGQSANIGNNAQGSIALGPDSKIDNGVSYAIAVGNSTVASASYSVAIGGIASVENAFGTALGYGAVATKDNGVALGNYSETNKEAAQISDTTITKGEVSKTFGTYAGTAVSVVSVGGSSDVSERQIINVAPGEVSATSTDAINGSQLYVVADQVVQNAADIKATTSTATSTATAVDTKGITFAGDSGTETLKKLGDKISVTGGNTTATALTDGNIGVVAGSEGLAVKLAKNLDLTADGGLTVGTTTIKNNEVKAADTTIDASGITTNKLAITNGPSMDANGINAGNKKISGVAKGVASTDAVNVDQLNSTVQSSVANISFDFAGDVANADGGKTEFTRTNTQKITVTGGAKAVTAKSDLSEGNIGVVVDDSTGTLAVKLAKDIDLSEDGSITMGKTVVDKDHVTVGDTTINSSGVATNKIAITGGPSMDATGINAGNKKISGVAKGVAGTDAVNVDQLTSTVQSSVANISFDFAGDVANADGGKTEFTRTNTQKITITGGAKAVTAKSDLSEGNIGVVVDDTTGTLAVKLAKDIDLSEEGSITIGKTVVDKDHVAVGDTTINSSGVVTNKIAITGGPSMDATGINAGGKKISGVAKGKDDSDAVNVGQLKESLSTAVGNISLNFAGDIADEDGHKFFARKSGTTIKITGGAQAITDTSQLSEGNIGVVVDAKSGELAIKLAKDIGLTDGSVTTSNTEEKTKGVLAGDKLTLTENESADGASFDKKAEISSGEMSMSDKDGNNTSIKSDGIKVSAGDDKPSSSLGNDGLRIESPDGDKSKEVSITDKGLNNGGQQIKNVAAGTETSDAVNLGQLTDKIGEAIGDISLGFVGDDGNKVAIGDGGILGLAGGVTDKKQLSDGNIGVISNETGNGFDIKLAKDLTGLNSVTTGNTTINNDGLAVKGKDGKDGAVITNDGLAIKGEDGKDKVVVKGDKVDMGGNVIHNVGAGEAPSDAVNRGQLDAVSDRVDGLTGDLGNLNGRVNKLNNRVNEVGAGAAALAALNPLDFNPDDKWNFAVGYGNYKNADAFAIGAYYQPNEDTRFSIGSTLGNGDEMINAGVSIRFGQSNGVSTSRVALAKDVESLKRIVQQLVAENEQLRRGGNGMTSGYPDISDREFPDVPKNHWAYEYVDTITKKGFTIGYPDGEFKGDRTLTRYEFAAVVYRALKNGAEIDGGMARAIDEFGPELARLEGLDHSRVDRVAGEDNDRFKIERLRVNNKDNAETGDYRDIYGSKIQKEEVAQ